MAVLANGGASDAGIMSPVPMVNARLSFWTIFFLVLAPVVASEAVLASRSSAGSTAKSSGPKKVTIEERKEIKPVVVEPEINLEIGGLLIRQGGDGNPVRYTVTYTYDHDIWASRLSFDGQSHENTSIRFARWELNGTWSYLPPDAQNQSVIRTQERKRSSILEENSGESAEEKSKSKPLSSGPKGIFIQSGNSLFVAGSTSNSIYAVDLSSGKIDKTRLDSGVFKNESILRGPVSMLEMNNSIYVAGSKSNNVVMIDASTGAVKKVIEPGKNLISPSSMVRVGNSIYVAGSESNTIVSIDSTGKPATFFKNEGVLRGPSAMIQMGNSLYVAGSISNTIIAIDLGTQELQGVIKDEAVMRRPMAMVQVGKNIYVAGSQSNTIVFIGTAAKGFSSTKPVEVPLTAMEPLMAQAQATSVPPVRETLSTPDSTPIGIYTKEEAVKQYPELLSRIPEQAGLVLTVPEIRIHTVGPASTILRKWLLNPAPFQVKDFVIRGAEQYMPYSIIVTDSKEPDPALGTAPAVVNLDFVRLESVQELVRYAAAQWIGRPIANFVGAVKLEDGSFALFVKPAI